MDQVLGNAIGIDLGLKDFFATCAGGKVEAQRFYRDLEPKLAIAQRSNKKQRVKAIHAKIANRRKDFLHKESTSLVRKHQANFVGNVSASGLARTSMGKFVLDAGWSTFRTMLQYKCDSAGVWFKVVNESFSTQDCSSCGSRSGPKGREVLHERAWTCSDRGTHYDRYVNAGTNIKVRGSAWLEKEILDIAAAPQARARETVVNKGSVKNAIRGRTDPLVAGFPLHTAQAAASG